MKAASTGRRTGVALAVCIGGPALIGWGLWALFIGTLVYSAVVATMTA